MQCVPTASSDAQSLLDGDEQRGDAVLADCTPEAQSCFDGSELCGDAVHADCTPGADVNTKYLGYA